MKQPVTSWRGLVGLASTTAFVLGAGAAWLWLGQRETTALMGYRNEVAIPLPQNIPHPPVAAAATPSSPPLPDATIAKPSQASVPRLASTVTEQADAHAPVDQTRASTGNEKERNGQRTLKQPASFPPQLAQALQQRKGSGASQPPTGKNVLPRKAASETLMTNGVRSWQRSGQWVLLVTRGQGQQMQRVEQARQQLAPLVPQGLQLVVLSLPKRQARLLVLGPFPSEEAAGAALWTLPTPFLLKQPQVMPARSLF